MDVGTVKIGRSVFFNVLCHSFRIELWEFLAHFFVMDCTNSSSEFITEVLQIRAINIGLFNILFCQLPHCFEFQFYI